MWAVLLSAAMFLVFQHAEILSFPESVQPTKCCASTSTRCLQHCQKSCCEKTSKGCCKKCGKDCCKQSQEKCEAACCKG